VREKEEKGERQKSKQATLTSKKIQLEDIPLLEMLHTTLVVFWVSKFYPGWVIKLVCTSSHKTTTYF